MKKQISIRNLVFAFLGGLVLLFIVGPLIGLFFSTTPNTILETLAEKEVYDSIWLTLFTAMGATLFFAVAAIPFSYLLARKNFPFKKVVLGIIDLPIVIPHTAAGIAILGVISRESVVGKLADSVGLSFIGSPIGISIAMAFVSIPFLINSARDGFAAVPERLEKAALNLGASPARVFFTIALPLAWRNIISGMIMMFARGMSEFGAVVIIAYYPMITPILIWERFGAYGIKYAQPVAIIFITVTLLIFIGLRLLTKEKQENN